MRFKHSIIISSLMVLILLTLPYSWAELIKGKAPDFTLKSHRGDNLKLSEYRGEVVMLNFWGSWCGPCEQEMPAINRIYLRYRDKGFVLLSVNLDDNKEKATRLINELSVAFPVLWDSANKVSEAYQIDDLPSTVLIDRDGNMRYRHSEYEPGQEDIYQEQIRELMSE